MKNRIIIIVFGLIILLGLWVLGPKLYAHQIADESFTNEPFIYEITYMHLDQAGQDEMDLVWIQSYITLSQSKDVLIDDLSDIKENIISTYDIEYTYPQYGMMNFGYRGCHGGEAGVYQYGYQSYEWVYIHGSLSLRNEMDQLLLDKLSESSYAGLTDQNLIELFHQLKTEVLETI
jgi:hypothetical protein